MRSALEVNPARSRNDVLVSLPPFACVGGLWATGLEEVSHDPRSLETSGRWVVVIPYEGAATFLKFATWEAGRPEWVHDSWQGVSLADWRTSLDESAYRAAVEMTQEAIGRGDVYQANICRVISAPCSTQDSLLGLFDRLVEGNPAPFAAIIHAPQFGVEIVSASPELFLRRSGTSLVSGPIKGTGRTPRDLLAKDSAENVMIVDLVRNDLSRVCMTGTVEVPRLLHVEEHPGLVHLVSEVRGQMKPGTPWSDILDATFPPGSVTGAPKSSALRIIAEMESVSRRVYCGAVGWIDADQEQGELAVAIRTFWRDEAMLNFGTGAGITWDSDSQAEWRETELKASRLIGLATEGAT